MVLNPLGKPAPASYAPRLAWTLHLGAAVYALNLLVGLAAQLLRANFGVYHHWLYAIVFAAALAATILAFHPGLVLTIVALGVMPLTKPGGKLHPTVAVVGAAGYALAYLT